ncbi:hypothetical protein F4694_000577 [Bacillus niacini]|uniref:Glycosyl transferase n=1 Tax=Neobacillus niacini TaxID=86668 RepID=A0A852T8K3_9BACI|nr:ATP-grasp fold amidoligase family protein [Neobacillus niacini]NYE03858.1 hypothetical protein [Neobacillus niacini]
MAIVKEFKKRFRWVKKNPWILLVWNERRRIQGEKEIKKYTDKQAIDILYKSHVNQVPNLDNPTKFSEKLQWLKLYYRDPLMTQCADKYSVRDYVTKCGYGEILNPLINSYENVDDIDLSALPDKFVLKGSHGSAWNIICKDKSKINWRSWKLIMKSWMRQNLYWYGREWVYKDIKPRIICEEYIEDQLGSLLDYKFFCFNGEPKFVQVDVGRFDKQNYRNFYDLDWNLLPFGKDIPHNPNIKFEKPKNFSKMVEIARTLSQPFPYVRADFYNVNGKIYFGELTFFPASGTPDFRPSKYDEIVGSWLVLPERNN